ncbi:MAG TPA: CHAT domain-containing protein [Roseiflexaceae bacterium]|nr:CHAT domain-containing protein [Roseiflexaceae bacterium]HMP38801.1 CHAT domain-containing protein [Roseiflexaceae bacterium]
MIDEFLDFEIDIQERRGRSFPISVRSPAGDAQGALRIPADLVFQQLIERLHGFSTDEATLEQLGGMLYSALFRDQIKECLISNLNRLGARQALRLRLRIAPGETDVAALPWEFLCDPNGQRLTLGSAPIVRYMPQLTPPPRLLANPPLRVLLSAAQTPPHVDVERELQIVAAAFNAPGLDVQVTIEPHLTAQKLQRHLRERPAYHVWHFVGHGQSSVDGRAAQLRFEDDQGDVAPISAGALAVILDRSPVRLIVLNACESGRLSTDPFRSLAPALVRAQIPAVIAQQFRATSEATRVFAEEFYRALAGGLPLEACMTEGRKAVVLTSGLGRADWGVPVLYSRAPDGRLFELSATAEVTGIPDVVAPTEAATDISPPLPIVEDRRVANIWIDGMMPGAQLQPGRTYTMMWDVGTPRDGAWATVDVGDLFAALPADSNDAELIALLSTEHLTLYGGDDSSLVIPRFGPSMVASFTFEARRAGVGGVTAIFIAGNRVVRQVSLRLRTQEPRTQPVVTGAAVMLQIERTAGGYTMVLREGETETRALLDLSEAQIVDLIVYARRILSEQVVRMAAPAGGWYDWDESTVPETIYQAAVGILARLGYYLYQRLFYAPGSTTEANRLGERLRNRIGTEQVHVHVADDEFMFPWALLYDRDPFEATAIDVEGFWGMAHLIEQVPPIFAAAAARPTITVRNQLLVGAIFDPALDQSPGSHAVASQRDTLDAFPGVTLTPGSTLAELQQLLGTPDSAQQLVYICCRGDGGRLGIGTEQITVDELRAIIPNTHPPLVQAPFVALSTPLSLLPSPSLGGGIAAFLARRGVRNVLGLTVDLPRAFSTPFLLGYLRRLAAGGVTTGALLRDMRRDAMLQRHNPLGLAVTLFGSSQVHVQRERRLVQLSIQRAGSGFDATLRADGEELRARLAISRAELRTLLERGHQTLRDVIFMRDENQYLYQRPDLRISEAAHRTALGRLAEFGYGLYQALFYGPGADEQTRLLGDRLRRLSQENLLTIEIESDRFRFLWALLYDRDLLDLRAVEPDAFWGFRHVIGQRISRAPSEAAIVVDGELPLRLCLDRGLEQIVADSAEADRIQRHTTAIGTLPGVQLQYCESPAELYAWLADPADPQLIDYFVCRMTMEQIGFGTAAATLEELEVLTPTHRPPLVQAPLMLLNSAGSAVWDPDLMRGVVLHMLARGARCVIGTEEDTSLFFALAFGEEFVRRFAAGGVGAGELLLDLRREFLERHNNVLGLFYTLYGNAATHVQRRDR